MRSILHFISDQAVGVSIALAIATLIAIGQRIDHPETDALQRSADIDNQLAAENAAERALVASKD